MSGNSTQRAAQTRPLVTVWATQSLTLGEQSLSGATETGPFTITLENSLKGQRRETQACSCPERAVLQLPAALMVHEISSVPQLPKAIFLLSEDAQLRKGNGTAKGISHVTNAPGELYNGGRGYFWITVLRGSARHPGESMTEQSSSYHGGQEQTGGERKAVANRPSPDFPSVLPGSGMPTIRVGLPT